MPSLEEKKPLTRAQIEEFDFIISTINPYGGSGSPEMEQAKSVLIALAEQGYWPACLELYNRAEEFFHFNRPEKPSRGASQQEREAYDKAISAFNAKVRAQGRAYLEQAAKGGYAPAQFRLAVELQAEERAAAEAARGGGFGMAFRTEIQPSQPQDQSESKVNLEEQKEEALSPQSLLQQAADQGYAPAQFILAGYLISEMTKELSQRRADYAEPPVRMEVNDKNRILGLFEAAGRAGIADASLALGEIYSYLVDNRQGPNQELLALGIEVDHEKAAQYYLAAAQQGSSDAILRIAELNRNPRRDPSIEASVYYPALKQLAEEGYVEAQYQLGIFYRHYTDRLRQNEAEAPRVPVAIQADMEGGETAEKWLQKAADNHHQQAQEALNWLRGENKRYPYQRTPYHAPEQPSVQVLDRESWTPHYNYLWRKQRFEDGLFARSENGARGLEQKNQFTLLRFSWLYYALASFLGIGGSILAFQFSGSLSVLTALGLGPIAPFFLAGIMGALLATSLVMGLHLSLGRDLNQDTRKALLGFLVVLAPLSLGGLALLLAVTVFAGTGLVALVIASVLGALVGAELILSLALINKPKDKISGREQQYALVPRNSAEEFGWISLAFRGMNRDPQKTKNELIALAKQGYWPACLELHNGAQQFFHFDRPEQPRWGASQQEQVAYKQAIAAGEAGVRAQSRAYLEQAVKGGYTPAQFRLAMELQEEEKAAAEVAPGRGFGMAFRTETESTQPQDEGESRVNIEEQKGEVLSPQFLLEKAADQGYAPAKFLLALVLIEKFASERPGLALPRLQAFKEQAAVAVESAETQAEKVKILDLLGASAEAGNPVALVILGDIYSAYSAYSGYNDYSDYPGILQNKELLALGIEVDHEKAAQYYLAAAQQGSSDAILRIAELNRNPRRDPSIEASAYYQALKQIAKEGYVEAQYQLGLIYASYKQLPEDPVWRKSQTPPAAIQEDMETAETAEKWLQKAIDNRHYGAGLALSRLRGRRDRVEYSCWWKALYHVPEQLEPVEIAHEEPGAVVAGVAARLPKEPSVQPWNQRSWISRCDYNWRKQYVDINWLTASKELADETRAQQGNYFALLRFFWPRYALGFLLGAGGSILAFQFLGSLSVLTIALGLGPVAPFFLIGAAGALLGVSLVLGVHLSVGGLDEQARKMLLKSLVVLAPLSLSGLALLLAVTVFAGTGPAALAIAGVLGVLVGILPVLSLALMKPNSPVARMLLGSLGKGSVDGDKGEKVNVAREKELLLAPEPFPRRSLSSDILRDRASCSSALNSRNLDEDDSQETFRSGRY